MRQRLGAAIPEQSRGALYFVEIENTTALRDRFGYAALEGALVDTGRHVGELAGEHLVSRLNDNTFVVYAAELAAREFGTFARSLRDGITRHQLTIEGEPLRLRALVGYASLQSGFERSEEHTSELQSLMRISYAVFCLKKKNINHEQSST